MTILENSTRGGLQGKMSPFVALDDLVTCYLMQWTHVRLCHLDLFWLFFSYQVVLNRDLRYKQAQCIYFLSKSMHFKCFQCSFLKISLQFVIKAREGRLSWAVTHVGPLGACRSIVLTPVGSRRNVSRTLWHMLRWTFTFPKVRLFSGEMVGCRFHSSLFEFFCNRPSQLIRTTVIYPFSITCKPVQKLALKVSLELAQLKLRCASAAYKDAHGHIWKTWTS